MRIALLVVLIITFVCGAMLPSGCGFGSRVEEKVQGGFDTAIKGRDKGQEAALRANLNSDPVLQYHFKQGLFDGTVSHGVATLTGRLPSQALIDQAVELAEMVKDIKKVINEITVDETIEDAPFDW